MLANTKFLFKVTTIIRILVVIWALLVLTHFFVMQLVSNPSFSIADDFGIEGWHASIFDLDEEESFGTFYNSALLFISGILIFVKSKFLFNEEKKWRKHWVVLGSIFCFLSMDEIVGLHEYINTFSDEFQWTLVALPFLIIGIISYLPFMIYYKGRTTKLLIIAAIIYIGGAVVVEHITPHPEDIPDYIYNIHTTIEEGMEIMGVIILIYTLLDNIRGKTNHLLEVSVGIVSKKTLQKSRRKK